jgi:ribonucleoside-triphosphate reductase
MLLAKKSLEAKRKVLESFTENDLYPYTKHYLRGVKKETALTGAIISRLSVLSV